MGLQFRQIARNLCISLGTVHNFIKKFEATGDVTPLSSSNRDHMRVLNGEQELLVVGLLFENPSLYLSEVCLMVSQTFGILISPPTVCRILHKHGLTRKKIKQVALQ